MLDIFVPDRRVEDFRLCLQRPTHALIYRKWQLFFIICHGPRLLQLLHLRSILTILKILDLL